MLYGRFAANEYPLMPPGIAWNYSNPNFTLAGLVTERLANRPWPEVVRERVFAPLSLDHTYSRVSDVVAAEDDIASGHGVIFPDGLDSFSLFDDASSTVGWVAPHEQPDNAFIRPAGLVWSTAEDHARLLGFLMEGDEAILASGLREEMMTSQVSVSAHDVGRGYGFGLLISDGYVDHDGAYRPTRAIQHGGNTMSMSSAALMLPELGIAVAVLANGADDVSIDALARVAIETIAGDALPPVSASPIILLPPAADLTPYAGDYQDPNLGDISLRVEDGKLHISAPIFAELGLSVKPVVEAISLDVFAIDVDGQQIEITFYRDATGTPAWGVNRAFVLSRR